MAWECIGILGEKKTNIPHWPSYQLCARAMCAALTFLWVLLYKNGISEF